MGSRRLPQQVPRLFAPLHRGQARAELPAVRGRCAHRPSPHPPNPGGGGMSETPNPTSADLLERVKAASGPDRLLDDDILFATGHRYSMSFLSETGWRWKGVNLSERNVPITASL